MDNIVLVISFTLLKFLPFFHDFKHRKIQGKGRQCGLGVSRQFSQVGRAAHETGSPSGASAYDWGKGKGERGRKMQNSF
jgi:hypothetical protein